MSSLTQPTHTPNATEPEPANVDQPIPFALTPAAHQAIGAEHPHPSLPLVVLEEKDFGPNYPMVYLGSATRHHIGWNPALTTRDRVEAFIHLHIAAPGQYTQITPAADKALQHLRAFRQQDPSPAAVAFADCLERLVIRAVFAQVLDCIKYIEARG
ncbi:hypothetical protein AB0E27_24730 [Streptomyces sparsogenes]|uniref:hypothetical protein n=1 Tax=Streptomyces sparsogenes TaxID=67365 RepID=UPI00340FAB24